MKRSTKLLNLLVFTFGVTFMFSQSVYAYCPLGPDVTKDLYNVLKIINYAAPLLCIVYTTIEMIKSLSKGDIQGDLKPLAKKFLKRLMYTAILFFLPILVDLFMQLAGVWGEDGGCDLQAATSNGVEDSVKAYSVYEEDGWFIDIPESILL